MEFILFILKWGLGLFFGLILFFIMCWIAGYAFHKGTEAYYEELINKGKFPARLWEEQKKNSKNNQETFTKQKYRGMKEIIEIGNKEKGGAYEVGHLDRCGHVGMVFGVAV